MPTHILRQREEFAPKMQYAAANGTILISQGVVLVTKATAAALTLLAPRAGSDDGKRLTIVSSTAAAHVITFAAGFNGGGAAKDTATLSGAIGDSLTLIAANGLWLIVASIGVTLT